MVLKKKLHYKVANIFVTGFLIIGFKKQESSLASLVHKCAIALRNRTETSANTVAKANSGPAILSKALFF
jgi:hypothetical protein